MEEKSFERKWWKTILWQLRWIITWVVVFSIAGIVIQSLREGRFVLIDFFGSNFKAWLSSFGNLTQFTQYAGSEGLVGGILKDWYYFFYAGGLISLVWELVRSVFRIINKSRTETKRQRTYEELAEEFEQKN